MNKNIQFHFYLLGNKPNEVWNKSSCLCDWVVHLCQRGWCSTNKKVFRPNICLRALSVFKAAPLKVDESRRVIRKRGQCEVGQCDSTLLPIPTPSVDGQVMTVSELCQNHFRARGWYNLLYSRPLWLTLQLTELSTAQQERHTMVH